jgi:hypothetical protein
VTYPETVDLARVLAMPCWRHPNRPGNQTRSLPIPARNQRPRQNPLPEPDELDRG